MAFVPSARSAQFSQWNRVSFVLFFYATLREVTAPLNLFDFGSLAV